jgi:hypothetical protein
MKYNRSTNKSLRYCLFTAVLLLYQIVSFCAAATVPNTTIERNSSPSTSLLPPPDTTIYVDICDGVPYHFHGHTYESDSTETITLPGQASDGGDSIINLIVTEHSSPTVSISANPANSICEGESITLTAECDCYTRDTSENFSKLSAYFFIRYSQRFGDICPYSDYPPIPGIGSCSGNAPGGENFELSNYPDNVIDIFPIRSNIYPAGNAIKLGKDDMTTPESTIGSITSIPLDLSNPFKITITAKGWGEEPGKIIISVDGIPQQIFNTVHNGWGAGHLTYADTTLYFPAATNSSIITIQTDTIIKANGDITGYRAFINHIDIIRLCHYSWSTGIADTNAVIIVQPENDINYSVTVTSDYGCNALATYNVIVNHPQGTSDTIKACGSYTWHGETYTQSGTYYYTRLIADANGCYPVDTLQLTINDIPIVHISGNLNITEGQHTTLIATPTGDQPYTYTWQSGTWSADSATNTLITEALSETTIYTVTVSDTNGCQGNDTATVNVTLCESWQLVTDASELAVGDRIVITNRTSNYALSTTQNSNNRGRVGISSNNNTITINEQVQIITLRQGNISNFYALYVDNGYLYATSGNNNYLRTQPNDSVLWDITFSNNNAIIVAQGETITRNTIKYNTNNFIFSCYSPSLNSNVDSIKIYKLYASYSDTTVTACNSFTLHDSTFTSSGNYSVVLSNAAANGCDSTIYLHLTILTEVHGPDTTAEACGSFTWHGTTYNTSGDKEYRTTTAAGCDSIVTLHLTIKEIPNALITTNPATPIICEESSITLIGSTDCVGTEVILEESFNGLSGNNTNTDGSSSLINISEFPNLSSSENVYKAGNAIRIGKSKTAGYITSKELDLTQDYTVTISAKGWINTSSSTTIKISATNCSSVYSFNVPGFTSGATSYFSSYQHDFNAATASPSRLTIETTGGDKRAFIDYIKITKEAPCNYTWHTPSGVISSAESITISPSSTTWYYFSVTAPNGCVGVDSVEVVVLNNTYSDTTAVACNSFTWHNKTHTESGDYNDTLTNALGCDSVVTLHLTIHNPTITFDDTDPLTACAGEDVVLHAYAHGNYEINYTWNFPDGHSLGWFDSLVIYNVNASDAGTYEVNASSTIFLSYSPLVYCMTSAVKSFTVTVNTPVHEHFSEVACESYTWHWLGGGDTTYTESGDYTHSHEDINGCTQVDTLHLTINRSIVVDTTVVACDSFSWHGNTYMWSGNYSDTLTNAAGCDSIITLHLSITEVNISINASADTICAGEVDTLWVERVSPIAIGDILCTDNSFVKPVDWEDAAAMGKVALGIVFYVDNTGEHGWAVHLHNSTSPKRWTLSPYNTDIHPLFNYPNAREAIKDLDGYTNTQRIRSASNATPYPADIYPAVYAVDFEHGWYLPAAGQLRLLYAERHTINASLEAVSHTQQQGVTPIADTFQYWSSTECNQDEAWGVTNSMGWVRNVSKNDPYYRTCNIRNF